MIYDVVNNNKQGKQQDKQLMNKFFNLFRTPVRQYKSLSVGDIPFGLSVQYSNKMYWTPRFQKIKYTQELLKYLRYLQRSRIVNYTDMRKLTQNILTQYHTLMQQDRPTYPITMQKNIYLPANDASKYHGHVDWLYSVNGLNPTPVLFFQKKFNSVSGIAAALSNMYLRKHLKEQTQKVFKSDHVKYEHANSYGQNNVYGYCILTTGHMWQVIRIDCNFYLEKSVIIQANNQYRTLYHDEQLVQVILGMLDFCLDLPHMNVRVLEKSYQYIGERRWMIQGKDNSQIQGASLISKLLLNYYKKKF